MADYIIAPANVKLATVDEVKPAVSRVEASVAVTAGQALSIDSATGLAVLADGSDVVGIAINSCDADQLIDFIGAGFCELGAVGSAGDAVVQSTTAGGLAPHADLVATNTVNVVGYFITDTIFKVAIANLGVERG